MSCQERQAAVLLQQQRQVWVVRQLCPCTLCLALGRRLEAQCTTVAQVAQHRHRLPSHNSNVSTSTSSTNRLARAAACDFWKRQTAGLCMLARYWRLARHGAAEIQRLARYSDFSGVGCAVRVWSCAMHTRFCVGLGMCRRSSNSRPSAAKLHSLVARLHAPLT